MKPNEMATFFTGMARFFKDFENILNKMLPKNTFKLSCVFSQITIHYGP